LTDASAVEQHIGHDFLGIGSIAEGTASDFAAIALGEHGQPDWIAQPATRRLGCRSTI
jgi:hypothetical protein